MSWGAQNRSEDAKTPSVAGVWSKKPEPASCPIQPYLNGASIHSSTNPRPCRCVPGLLLLLTGIGCGTLALAPRTDTHNTTTLVTQSPSRPPNYRHASTADASRSPHIHLAAAPFLSFSPNAAPALTSECVRWRECEMHKFG
jgi:hypothetical protein